jgi:hypothetical protein
MSSRSRKRWLSAFLQVNKFQITDLVHVLKRFNTGVEKTLKNSCKWHVWTWLPVYDKHITRLTQNKAMVMTVQTGTVKKETVQYSSMWTLCFTIWIMGGLNIVMMLHTASYMYTCMHACIHTFHGSIILSQGNRMWNKSQTYKNIQNVQNFTLQKILNILYTVLEVIIIGYQYTQKIHLQSKRSVHLCIFLVLL